MRKSNRIIPRLMLAALVSGLGFAGTTHWYKATTPPAADDGQGTPIARVIEANNEVQRRQKKRVMWQNAGVDTLLVSGESLRTGSGSAAQIEFLASKTVIDLEPDSLIVLEESAGREAIDYVKGSLFVKGESSELTVKSGASEIALQGAELSLGKDKSGELNLQVYGGKATVQANGKSTAVTKNKAVVLGGGGVSVETSMIEALAPSPTKPVYVNALQPKPVRFQWKPLPPGWDIRLETGTSRQDIRPYSEGTVPGERGELSAPVRLGVTYWRLVAVPRDPAQKTASSQPYRLQVLAQNPPIPLIPGKDQVIRMKPNDPILKFSWANPARLVDVRFEVSSSPDMSRRLISKVFTEGETSFDTEVRQPGVYYWRLSGSTEDRKMDFASPVQRFSVQPPSDFPAPVPRSPLAGQRLPLQTVKENGLFLSWDGVPDAVAYRLTVRQGSEVILKELIANQFRIPEPSLGEYAWHVEAKSESGQYSKVSPTRTFRVEEIRNLQWLGRTDPDIFWYVAEHPMVELAWDRGGEDVKSWQLKIFPDGVDPNTVEPVKLSTTRYTRELPKDGFYVAFAEAVAEDGYVVARSNRRTVLVKRLPPPEAPAFDPNLPPQIMASRSGDVEIIWKPVKGAQVYHVQIKSASGQVIKEMMVKDTRIILKRMMPGEYEVSLYATDQHGRRGPASERRPLKVPEINALAKPKLKKIKIQ